MNKFLDITQNKEKEDKKSFKYLLTPEKIKEQKLLFNRSKFGLLNFFFSVVYKSTNVFFTFYCKSQNFPNRVFIFFKSSLGLENRDKIRKGVFPKVPMRGRRKNQYVHIRNKFNHFKAYIYDFIKAHPEIVPYKKFFMIWKIYLLDNNIQGLMEQDIDISYSYNILERVMKEQAKNEILDTIKLRPKIKLTQHDIIYNYYSLKKNIFEELPLDFIFEKDKKKKLLDIKKLFLDYLNNANKVDKFQIMLEYITQYYINANLLIDGYIEKFQILDVYTKCIDFIDTDLYESKDLELVSKDVIPLNNNSVEINEALDYLENNLEFDEFDVELEQPIIIHDYQFKFTHNGCRPKKARRCKRTNH